MTKRAWLFLVLSFGLNLVVTTVFLLIGGRWNTPSAMVVAVGYMFCPMVAVLVLEKIVYHNDIKKTCGIRFKFNFWFLVAWFLPLIVSFASLAVSDIFPGTKVSFTIDGLLERFKDTMTQQQVQQLQQQFETIPFNPVWFAITQALIAGITINALVSFGEEIGWRGFLFNELIPRMGFWKTSGLTGFIWGLWHLPLVLQGHNYPHYRGLGVLWMTIFCILWSPIFNFIRIKSGSVIATSILHGSLNATAGFSFVFIKGGNELITGILGVSGFIVVAIVDIIIWLRILGEKNVYSTDNSLS